MYSPYKNRENLWVSLSYFGILDINNVILVGDLNFTTSPAEIWGLKENLDLLADFFITLLKIFELIGIIPQVLEPTWTNGRSGKEGIQKILDIFVVLILYQIGMPVLDVKWITACVTSA